MVGPTAVPLAPIVPDADAQGVIPMRPVTQAIDVEIVLGVDVSPGYSYRLCWDRRLMVGEPGLAITITDEAPGSVIHLSFLPRWFQYTPTFELSYLLTLEAEQSLWSEGINLTHTIDPNAEDSF